MAGGNVEVAEIPSALPAPTPPPSFSLLDQQPSGRTHCDACLVRLSFPGHRCPVHRPPRPYLAGRSTASLKLYSNCRRYGRLAGQSGRRMSARRRFVAGPRSSTTARQRADVGAAARRGRDGLRIRKRFSMVTELTNALSLQMAFSG